MSNKKAKKLPFPTEEISSESEDFLEESDQDLNDTVKQNLKISFHVDKYELSDDEEMEDVVAEMKQDSLPKHSNKISEATKDISHLYRAPTNEEIQGLKETADLFKSNIFKLKIDELLSEVQIDYEQAKLLENNLHQIKEIFDSIPDQPGSNVMQIKQQLKKRHKIVIPFPDPIPSDDVQYKFAFKKPTSIHLIGSYPLKTLTRGPKGFNVDIVVMMPPSIFQEKDYLNYRYFYKRAYYLAMLAASLQDKKYKMTFSVEFDTCKGDRRRPILLIRPSGNNLNEYFSKIPYIIRVFPGIPPDLFPIHRLAPSKNNVRPRIFQERQKFDKEASDTTTTLIPTPHYNLAILQDIFFISHLLFLHQQQKACPAFHEACVLAKIWLNQRGFGTGEDGSCGFNGFLWTMLMGYLLQGGGPKGNKKLANGFSSYQLFKGTMDFIANHDFVNNPIFLNKTGLTEEFSEKAFTENYDIVFVDMHCKLNLFGGISRVQHEAKLAMKYLNESQDDHFDSLFLRKVDDIKLRYDNLIKISNIPSKYFLYTEAAKLDFPDRFIHFARVAPGLLKKGLTDRIHLITVNHKNLPKWSITQQPPSYSSGPIQLFLGIILNQEQSNRVVDHGPSPEDEIASTKFRKLWGSKAEVRRFQDGSIVESVVWENAKSFESRSLIVSQIVSYLLKHHFGIREGICYWAGQLNAFIRPAANVPSSLFNPEIARLGFQPVMAAFNSLVKQINGLEDIPLGVSSITGASPVLRYSSVFIPQPVNLHSLKAFSTKITPYVEPIDVILQFESSGKWPDDLVAIQKMKIALYIRLVDRLKKQYHDTFAWVVTDNKDSISANNSYMDVLTDTGYIFRCRIHHDREKTLLERGIKNKKLNQLQINAYDKALSLYNRLFIEKPMHNFQIHALCSKYPSLSVTNRLLKRFFSAHLLLTHIEEEFIELLCAAVYLEPSPWNVPSNGFVGFFRVLSLLSLWDFRKEPLIVDLGENMTTTTKNEIQEQFNIMRQNDLEMLNHAAMVIATSANSHSSSWSIRKPSRVVAFRIQELANLALNHMEKIIENDTEENLEVVLFKTDMTIYDVLIHLDPSQCSRYHQNISPYKQYLPELDHIIKNSNNKNIQHNHGDDICLIGFDSVERYLHELQELYSDIALFFHDRFGGDSIGVLWIPHNFSPRPWKVNIGYSSVLAEYMDFGEKNDNLSKPMLSSSLSNVFPNIYAIIADMEKIGAGLVTNIEILQPLLTITNKT
ncbi:11484_t:CDS:10 [Ambispora gerdemannii]|uniref:U3 small nucleolar RNA-associated protein 22 n=1 Tax=Ambispora gerdemannii TaxID=144530 RepID=A0A9N8Z3Z2_9GLOM|nr:11484_t:CDS:10 [Ambispora gerdemannii]